MDLRALTVIPTLSCDVELRFRFAGVGPRSPTLSGLGRPASEAVLPPRRSTAHSRLEASGRSFFCLQPQLYKPADGLGMAWGVGLFIGPSVDLLAEAFGKAQRGRRHLTRRGAASLFLSYDN